MIGRRAAVIDVGTNSVLLTIAHEVAVAGDADGPVVPGVRHVAELELATITRLGEGVDQTRRLSPSAVERTLACLRAYAESIRASAVDVVGLVGTSALRDARGGEGFVRQASEIVGAPLEVISGDREAELTFRGALSGLEVEGPVVVFDIGGGSTEIITGTAQGRPRTSRLEAARSFDVGSVRLTERHVRSDPPRPQEIAAIRADIRAGWSAPPREGSLQDGKAQEGRLQRTAVGVAGTVTALAALALELETYQPARVHGALVEASAVDRLVGRLASLSLEERQRLPGLEPRRADVIVAGAVLVAEVLRHLGASQLVVSDRGVRWGLLDELLSVAPSP